MDPNPVIVIATAALSAALGGLGGSFIGNVLTTRREETSRRYAFVEKQVRELYSPLVGIRREIRAKSELRQKIRGVIRAKGTSTEMGAAIGHDNLQFDEELLPAYQRLLRLLTDGYWLAEQSTRGHYEALLEYVEIWLRWKGRSIPPEVVTALGHSEQSLREFYEDIQTTFDLLRARLAAGAA